MTDFDPEEEAELLKVYDHFQKLWFEELMSPCPDWQQLEELNEYLKSIAQRAGIRE